MWGRPASVNHDSTIQPPALAAVSARTKTAAPSNHTSPRAAPRSRPPTVPHRANSASVVDVGSRSFTMCPSSCDNVVLRQQCSSIIARYINGRPKTRRSKIIPAPAPTIANFATSASEAPNAFPRRAKYARSTGSCGDEPLTKSANAARQGQTSGYSVSLPARFAFRPLLAALFGAGVDVLSGTKPRRIQRLGFRHGCDFH